MRFLLFFPLSSFLLPRARWPLTVGPPGGVPESAKIRKQRDKDWERLSALQSKALLINTLYILVVTTPHFAAT